MRPTRESNWFWDEQDFDIDAESPGTGVLPPVGECSSCGFACLQRWLDPLTNFCPRCQDDMDDEESSVS